MTREFGLSNRSAGGALTRFINPAKSEPSARGDVALSPNHAALSEGRTVFPSRVFDADHRDRVLIDGHNNAKIGRYVTKGPWSGFPIFMLTLEERATCPRDCAVWSECYGNAMPMSVRFRYTPSLVAALDFELRVLAKQNPRGFAVRLHILGDFPDLAYVAQWWRWMETIPALHVWGYTAHPPGSEIGRRLSAMNAAWPSRWAIRSSLAPESQAGPMQAVVTWDSPGGTHTKGGIVCPAETGRTATCGTCGLCWSESARDLRIVFLGHGTKRGRPARPESPKDIVAQRPPMMMNDDMLTRLRVEHDRLSDMLAAIKMTISVYEQQRPVEAAAPKPAVSDRAAAARQANAAAARAQRAANIEASRRLSDQEQIDRHITTHGVTVLASRSTGLSR